MLDASLTPEQNFNTIWGFLRRGAADSSHPFRYLTLTTVSANGVLNSRMLVLRGITDSDSLLLFTDSRSGKMDDIAENVEASALFWHPQKKVQVSLGVRAKRVSDPEIIDKMAVSIKGKARKSYTMVGAPGTEIADPEIRSFYNFDEQNYFTVLELDVHTFGALQLGRDLHLRIGAQKRSGAWKINWLVP